MKKAIIRWTAVYETEVEVDENTSFESDCPSIRIACDSINIDVEGSECQVDTLEIESVKEKI